MPAHKHKPSSGALFLTFFKIGAVTFGGGYAMLPLIREEVVKRKKWISEEGFLNMIGITQSAPGVLAVNSAVFLGYQLAGVPGALAAALGASLPSFLIILVIAAFFTRFADNMIIAKIFMGIRPAIVALIAYTVINLGQRIIRDRFAWTVAGAALIAAYFFRINPAIVILTAAAAGLLYSYFRQRCA